MADEGVKTDAKLAWPLASLWSIANCSMDFYPRLDSGGRAFSQNSDSIMQEMGTAMSPWRDLDVSKDNGIDDAINLAKASLAEVKAQTEYQDQKATRLLTVTTFLSALSGALFAAFSAKYPHSMAWPPTNASSVVVAGAYLAFLGFVLAALAGALVTFHATRTRFKYPELAAIKKQDGPVKSHLFFQEIIRVTPKAWAGSFVSEGEGGNAPTLNQQLKIAYLRNYVGETYLVAAKTADKLRYLEPAQSLLAWALRLLILFVIFIALTQLFVTTAAPATGPNSSATGQADVTEAKLS